MVAELKFELKFKYQHRFLPVSVLEINPAAQRKLQPNWSRKIAEDFNADFFHEITVSLRDGRYYVVDGQHRVDALRRMGWSDQRIPCKVYEGLTVLQEAGLFLSLNDRKAIRAFDEFRIAITAGEAVPLDIERIVIAQGLVLSEQKRDASVSAVNALRQVYEGAGLAQRSPASLAKALKLLRSSWGTSSAAFDGSLILGAGLLFIRYGDAIDTANMTMKLAKFSGGPSGLLGLAKLVREMKRRPVGHCVAAVMVDAYNQGKRGNKLEDWWA